MKKINLLGFTLVELIVVITIVGILSTVGFVSYSGYLAGARDSNRFSQLTKLSDSLQVYAATKSLPLPDDYIEVTASGTVIAYQGYVGVDVLETIDYTNGGKDPKDGSYYTYYITKNRQNMQLLAFMEEQSSVSFSSQSYAADYTERVPKVYGKKLGVLTEVTSNTPIQEVVGLTTLDIVTTTDLYVSHLSDDKKLEGDGTVLQASIPNGSCKRIKQMGKSKGSKMYTINPAGTGNISVYCDMDTDGGGWTSLVRFNPSENNSAYWLSSRVEGDFYNYLDKKNFFDIKDIYINKLPTWDGGEYVFEKVGTDLYARRGALKDTVIRANWAGFNVTLNNWLGFIVTIDGYVSIGHTNVSGVYYDFPFYTSGIAAISDTPWGGRDYVGDSVVNIFIR